MPLNRFQSRAQSMWTPAVVLFPALLVAGSIVLFSMARTHKVADMSPVSVYAAAVTVLAVAFAGRLIYQYRQSAPHTHPDNVQSARSEQTSPVDRSEPERLTEQVAANTCEVASGTRAADDVQRLSLACEKLQQFSALAAHDLRTPLRHQAGMIAVLREDLDQLPVSVPSELNGLVNEMSRGLNRMDSLIEDLLDYARQNQLESQSERVNVGTRLPIVLELVSLPLGFKVAAIGPFPDLKVPATALDVVLRNLIANAAKHHDRAQGVIEITAGFENGLALLEVRDDGPGIPESYRDLVFKPFQKLSANCSGSGLGLTLVAETVAKWGGRVSVDRNSGRGAIFRFTAPVYPADAQNVAGKGHFTHSALAADTAQSLGTLRRAVQKRRRA